jgi:hypothetical protein
MRSALALSLRHLRNALPAFLERRAPQRADLILQPQPRARPAGQCRLDGLQEVVARVRARRYRSAGRLADVGERSGVVCCARVD